ncbi:MAG: T9SS type A sorting domain-containing protein [Saprospiraceae bacterium]|nr:MAG: T9SS type A sorting domain-containing protein [Saprospiraceae bacterium]
MESLYLRSQLFKSNKFNNLGLASGDEVELTIGAIERTFSSDPAGLELNLCFWTSHPDLLMDLNASNDSYCADFLVNSKDVSLQNGFKLYPNPARDMLNLQWKGQFPLKDATCRLMNTEGKVMKQMEIDFQQGIVSISLVDRPSVVYFMQFLSDGDAILLNARFCPFDICY